MTSLGFGNFGVPAVPYRTLEQAMMDLPPFFEAFAAELDAAHAEFREKGRELLPRLGNSAKASCIRDIAVRRMIEMCDRVPGAHYIQKGQLGVIGLSNNWIVRIKKLRGFSVSVSPTFASDDYNRNAVPKSLQGVLFQAPPATCIYLGWSIPENAPHMIEKYLVCNNSYAEVAWVIPLDSYSRPPAEDLFGPSTPPPEGEPRRVRIKEGGRRKADG